MFRLLAHSCLILPEVIELRVILDLFTIAKLSLPRLPYVDNECKVDILTSRAWFVSVCSEMTFELVNTCWRHNSAHEDGWLLWQFWILRPVGRWDGRDELAAKIAQVV